MVMVVMSASSPLAIPRCHWLYPGAIGYSQVPLAIARCHAPVARTSWILDHNTHRLDPVSAVQGVMTSGLHRCKVRVSPTVTVMQDICPQGHRHG